MIFTPAAIAGAFELGLEKRGDDRGFFARTYCAEEFKAHGLVAHYVQMNTNFTAKRGAVKGLHWQVEPHGEAKLVRCIAGRVFDVMVDMRKDSPTYLRWQGFELDARDPRLVYVPPGCAHGFLSLSDDAEITYLVGHAYVPAAERGLRYNDPAIGIVWPIPVETVSAKDAAWPDIVR